MLERIKIKDSTEIIEFINENDKHEDFYITKNRERKFLKNYKVFDKAIKRNQMFRYDNNGLKGIIMICQEKGFRPFIRILSENKNVLSLMLISLKYIGFNKELYTKLKRDNEAVEVFLSNGFQIIGDRGKEVLLKN